jgi:hypothetical protein
LLKTPAFLSVQINQYIVIIISIAKDTFSDLLMFLVALFGFSQIHYDSNKVPAALCKRAYIKDVPEFILFM